MAAPVNLLCMPRAVPQSARLFAIAVCAAVVTVCAAPGGDTAAVNVPLSPLVAVGGAGAVWV